MSFTLSSPVVDRCNHNNYFLNFLHKNINEHHQEGFVTYGLWKDEASFNSSNPRFAPAATGKVELWTGGLEKDGDNCVVKAGYNSFAHKPVDSDSQKEIVGMDEALENKRIRFFPGFVEDGVDSGIIVQFPAQRDS